MVSLYPASDEVSYLSSHITVCIGSNQVVEFIYNIQYVVMLYFLHCTVVHCDKNAAYQISHKLSFTIITAVKYTVHFIHLCYIKFPSNEVKKYFM